MDTVRSSLQYRLLIGTIGSVWRAKYWVIGCAILGAGAALLLAANTARRYRVEAVVAPQSQSQSSGLASLMSQIGGLSTLAGLGLGRESSAANSMATLRGAKFTATFIRKLGLEPRLFPDRWDTASRRWMGNEPTDLELVRALDGNGIRTIIEDRRTGLITIRIQWTEPREAADILSFMLSSINDQLRGETLDEARRSVDYLKEQLEETSAVDLRQTINTLIATNLKQAVIANVRRDYAFHVVSEAVIPTARDFIWPRRMLMAATGVVLGGLLGLTVSLLISFFSQRLISDKRDVEGPLA